MTIARDACRFYGGTPPDCLIHGGRWVYDKGYCDRSPLAERVGTLYVGSGPKVDLPPIWSCMGCGQATNHFAAGSLVHPEDGLCQRCVDAIRAQTDALR